MIKDVCDVLAEGIKQQAGYITKLTGLIREARVSDGGSDKRRPVGIPMKCASCGDAGGKEISFAPDEKQSAIAYFETVGNPNPISVRRGWALYEMRVRFPVWINGSMVTHADFMESDLCRRFLKGSYSSTETIGSLRVIDATPEAAPPFDRWSYNEKETQFLAPPYSWCSILLTVRFIHNTNTCVPEISTKEAVC